jgi:hypothetical protein
MKELKVVLTEEMLKKPLYFELPTQTLYIDRSHVGDIKERGHNLIGFSRREERVNELVVKLATKGFFLVSSSDGNSKFEKFTTAKEFKSNVKVDNLQIYNNLYYTLEKPLLEFASNRLIVIFSSVADRAFNADIATRNFFTNFGTISKYIPQNSYVLRISDIGGIIGSFYMNTTFSDTIEDDIQGLLKFILNSNNIAKEDVVLYGGSKGGTSALYHGILGGYKCVAVDPIVSDKYHEESSGDSHFTKEYGDYRIYPRTKQDKFSDLMNKTTIPDYINIIYSEQSPVYNAINTIIKDNDIENRINYLNICHPKIKTHPDVAVKSINILMLVMNNLFYGLGEIKSKDIDCKKAKKVDVLKIKAQLKLMSLIIELNLQPSYLRVYSKDLKEYQDIELNQESSKVNLLKLKGKALSIVSNKKEYALEVDLSKSSILSKIVSYKEVEIENRSFSYLVIN